MIKEPMKVAILGAEVAPFAKAGGLGDVIGSLPQALSLIDINVKVFVPRYPLIDPKTWGLELTINNMAIYMPRGHRVEISVWRGFFANTTTPIYFIDIPKYFIGDSIYNHSKSGQSTTTAYLVFVKAALEVMKAMDWQPNIVHTHDWHTAIANKWLHTIYKDDPFFRNTASVLTIHNLAFQGNLNWYQTKMLGLVRNDFFVEKRLGKYKGIKLLATGIEAADMINTVSPTYAREITTRKYGFGLQDLMKSKKKRLFGILNGIDYSVFDPKNDRSLTTRYSVDSLDKKNQNKLALQKLFNLPEDTSIPLICIVSRLSSQKGIALIDQVIPHIMNLGAQFIILGNGDNKTEKIFMKASKDYPTQVATHLEFDADLAQTVYAGADMLLMPSRFEPMGLSQVIAMKFGTLPIVRKTGGLADTVINDKTGFVFNNYDVNGLTWALNKAINTWYNSKDIWRKMQIRAMKKDFSWKDSAKKYVSMYKKAIAYHRSGHPNL
jgi:starch synthase